MKLETKVVRRGYDGKQCLVHARCCYTPDMMLATAQYLNVDGSDLFSGLLMSVSYDEGNTWSPFEVQSGLAPIIDGDHSTVGCDATPIYHKKSGKILLLGQTAKYKFGEMRPIGGVRYTFYSVYDKENNTFSPMKLLQMPEGYENCGNGSGQSVELENGDLLIPISYIRQGSKSFISAVIRCSFDGVDLKLQEIGSPIEFPVSRGVYEPSIICHNSVYYITLRNDECGLVARSDNGMDYRDLQLWKWEDGSLLQNYNTQQHWMEYDGKLYLVYTRRDADNDHVFRHRAPLLAAEVKNMKLVRDSEFIVVEQRGARLGNFGAAPFKDGSSMVMAAEWMQPKGCEVYGSDNSIFLAIVKE